MFKFVVLFALFVAVVVSQEPPRGPPRGGGPQQQQTSFRRMVRQIPGMGDMSQQMGNIPNQMMDTVKQIPATMAKVGQDFMQTAGNEMSKMAPPGVGKRR